MNADGKKVLVVGTGISGIAASELLVEKGVDTILYDSNEKLCEADIRARSEKLKNIPVILGQLSQDLMEQCSIAVLSPGVPAELPLVEELRENGAEIWGEVELAYHFAKGRLAAITGTNGKTTTTALVGEILRSFYQEVFVVGNIGNAYTGEALKMSESSVTVAEISSFQLETIRSFHPQVSAILNITPDHLDRHHTMECYMRTKELIARNQEAQDTCVLNYDDEETRRFGELVKASVLYFSRKHILDRGVYLNGARIIYNDGREQTEICDISELHLLGSHNHENVMAAIAIGIAMGVPLPQIRRTVTEFRAVEHRIEFVAEKNGVVYYNDSKGTNTDASIKAVEAMTRPTLVIGGGYDKHVEFDDWVKTFDGRVKQLVLLGATAGQIADTARRYGFEHIAFAESMEEAVEICAEKAEPGDAVLLSPACASWGMFQNYEERGRIFKDCVKRL